MGILTAIITTTIFLPIIASANCGRITVDNATFVNDCGVVQLDGAGSPEDPLADNYDHDSFLDNLDEMGLNSFYALLHNQGGDGDGNVNPYIFGTFIFDTTKLERWQRFIDKACERDKYAILLLGEGEYRNKTWHNWQQRLDYYDEMIKWFDRSCVLFVVSEEIDGSEYRVPLEQSDAWLAYLQEIAIQPVGQHNATQCFDCFMQGYARNAAFAPMQVLELDGMTALSAVQNAYNELSKYNKPVFISEPPTISDMCWNEYRQIADWLLERDGNIMVYDYEHDLNLHDIKIWKDC